MRILLAAALLVAFLSVVSTNAQMVRAANYVGLGEPCNHDFSTCKNFLYCNSSNLCAEGPTEGMPCNVTVSTSGHTADPCNTPVTPYLACSASGMCEYHYRAAGDPCTNALQCLSGKCLIPVNSKGVAAKAGKCVGTLQLGAVCELSPVYNYACAEGLTCLTNPGNNTATCQPPRDVSTDCTADYAAWFPRGVSLDYVFPIEICAPGSACLPISPAGPDQKFNCTKLYNGDQDGVCFPPPEYGIGAPGPFFASLHCKYNMTCAYNGSAFYCTRFPKKNPSNCTVGANTCSLGYSCAVANSSTPLGSCEPYIGGNACSPLLNTWVTCMKKKKCAYRLRSLLNPYTLFAGPNNQESCVPCRSAWEDFMCCQNRGFNVKGPNMTASVEATDRKFPSTWARIPSGFCKASHTLPNFVVPLIVLGGILAVITVVVLIYIVLPRGSYKGYEVINDPK